MKTPNDIARELITWGETLRVQLDELKDYDEKAVRAKVAFNIAEARAQLTSTGTVMEREAWATEQTEHECLEMELAAVWHRDAVKRVRYIETQIDILRTVSATVREEWKATASGVGA